MKWHRLTGLKEVLAYANGRQAVREIQERIPEYGDQRYDYVKGIHKWDNATVLWFEDGEGLACFVLETGPALSDVTPDPAWDAEVFYWAVKP